MKGLNSHVITKHFYLKPFKVLFIHHCGVPGGASTSLINLLRFLPSEYIEKYVATPKGRVTELFKPHVHRVLELSTTSVASFFPSAEGIKFLLPRSLLGYIRHYRSLKEIIDIATELKPDIVHINDVPLIPTAISLSKLGYPIIMHARTAPGRNPGFFDRLQRHWMNKHVRKLICISESVRQGFTDVKSAEVVYNPIVSTGSGQAHHLPLGIQDTMNCLFLSNFLPYKGIYETIDAAKLLRDRKDIHFYIAGSNIRSPKFYKSLLGRLLDLLNVAQNIDRRIRRTIRRHDLKNVTMLGHVKDIDALLQGMHVNLAPVRLNAPPRSVFEAALHQVPTILALTDIVEDLVEHEKTGLIIPPHNPDAIANAILKLREDESARNRMGWNAMKKLSNQHDPIAGAQQVIGIYQQIINSKGASRHSVVNETL